MGGARNAPTALLRGELEHADALDDAAEVLPVVLEDKDLPDGEHDAAEPADERGAHIIGRKLLRDTEVPLQEADLKRERLQEWWRGRVRRCGEGRDGHCIAGGG